MHNRTEEEIVMTPDIEKRFDKIDGHLEKQDDHLREMNRAFTKHELDDSQMHGRIEVHLDEHARRETQRDNWKLAKIAGIFAVISAMAGAWYSNYLEQRNHRTALQEIKAELHK